MEMSNDNKTHLKIETTVLPTYLKEFFLGNEEIILVYDKRDDITSERVNPLIDLKKEHHDTSSALDLTGNPLKVDLEGSQSFSSYGTPERPNHWTIEESTHFSCTIKRAREYINQQNRIKKCEGEMQKPIYVLCDGNDAQSTVVLGAQKCNNKIMTTLITIIGCYSKDDEAISLENMEREHIKNTRVKNPKIDFLLKFIYSLYGTILQNVKDINSTEHNGSVSVEVTCNKCVFNVPQSPSNMKMVIKIIAGHTLSSVHFLWEELCLLQMYLDILSDSDKCNDDLTVICENPIEESEIYKSINNLIASNLLEREAKMKFDLKNIRQAHILDKLWIILKYSENLAVLRDSLHYFFEELVDAETTIKIPESDKSNIATIINGILNGKLAVPTLSFSQALECLLELGAEKLKNDYQAIIRYFYSASDQAISEKWSKFQNEKLTSQVGQRKTRITVNLKSGVIDLSNNTSKLAYLGKLHVATEFIFLTKYQVYLSEETFDYFCETVYKNYLDKDTTSHDFSDLQTSPLCEFSVILNLADIKIIERETPMIKAMQMSSKVGNLEITTTYHLSEYPIFPTAVYDSYDLSKVTGENKMIYYVSKLLKYNELI